MFAPRSAPGALLAGIALAVLIASAGASPLRLTAAVDARASAGARPLRALPPADRPRRAESTARSRDDRRPHLLHRASSSSRAENSRASDGCRRTSSTSMRLSKSGSVMFEFTPPDDTGRTSASRGRLAQKGSAARRVRRREAASRRSSQRVGDADRSGSRSRWPRGPDRGRALAWYLSRRICGPMLLARRGRRRGRRRPLRRRDPRVRADDEIGHLADRFREMAARLAEADERERNFLMSVSHELRTPLTAIRGHVDCAPRGRRRRPGARERLARA